MRDRPLIVVPARFSESASALRFRAEVTARALATAVFAAGGEPVTVHPHARDGMVDEAQVADRFDFADGVLLPGGGDITPALYGGVEHDEHYDMDPEQDGFDLALARWALHTGRPVLAICRGLQIVNVALGGTLVAHMDTPHRRVVSKLALEPECSLADALGARTLSISCYHHQALDRLGDGLGAVARSADGTVEAVQMVAADAPWFLGVQWHPEDTAATDPAQMAIFAQLVAASRRALQPAS
ncbi:gamma-glutamyl-gamma-aminobutyrate hydrolase family protein [Kribbella sp. CA-245084]|uniref:gamma-glutamyl-gamma-aminobutyrate hydrolase family protein n=1 Tax=Kribbella sp. CA-245084 TaxID=3239940 RepID=UPI003D8A8729